MLTKQQTKYIHKYLGTILNSEGKIEDEAVNMGLLNKTKIALNNYTKPNAYQSLHMGVGTGCYQDNKEKLMELRELIKFKTPLLASS